MFDNGEARAKIQAALAGVGVETAFTLLRCQAYRLTAGIRGRHNHYDDYLLYSNSFPESSAVTMRNTLMMYGGMCQRPFGPDPAAAAPPDNAATPWISLKIRSPFRHKICHIWAHLAEAAVAGAPDSGSAACGRCLPAELTRPFDQACINVI
jgi:hypothetical protein